MTIKKLPDGSYGVTYRGGDGLWYAERIHKADIVKARRDFYLSTERPSHRAVLLAAIGSGYAYSLATCDTKAQALEYVAREAQMIASERKAS